MFGGKSDSSKTLIWSLVTLTFFSSGILLFALIRSFYLTSSPSNTSIAVLGTLTTQQTFFSSSSQQSYCEKVVATTPKNQNNVKNEPKRFGHSTKTNRYRNSGKLDGSMESSNNKAIIRLPKHRSRNRFINMTTNWVSYFESCTFNYFDAKDLFAEITLTKEVSYCHIYKSGGTTVMHGLNELIDEKRLIDFTLYCDPNGKKRARNSNGNDFSGIKISDYLNFVYDINSINSQVINNITRFEFVNDNLLFTFVRDPIDKFLSAFYEIYRRVIQTHFCMLGNYTCQDFNKKGKTGDIIIKRKQKQKQKTNKDKIRYDNGMIDWNVAFQFYQNKSSFILLEKWIDLLYERNSPNSLANTMNVERLRNNFNYHYFNPHNWPNIAFLNKKMQFEFIGNLKNIVSDLKVILRPYFREKYLKDKTMVDKEIDRIFDSSKHFIPRDRHSKQYIQHETDPVMVPIINAFSFERQRLTDQHIFKLCNIFWVDYVCFPFQIPPQCNLSQIKEKYKPFYTIDATHQ